MTKKIVKRTDTNNETLYFYTHSDAVDVGEGSSTKSLTEVIDDTLHKSAQTLTNAEKTQVHANLGTESFVGDRAVRYDEAQVLGTSEKTQALTNLGLNGVDDVPTENSNNVVRSGGVKAAIDDVIDDFTNRGFIYKGIAPVSAPLGEDKTFYIAKSGDYSAYTGIGNDGSFSLNGIAVLTYATATTSGAWTKNDIVLFDEEPTAGSDNLVKSGGVEKVFNQKVDILNGENATRTDLFTPYYYIGNGGQLIKTSVLSYVSNLIPINEGESLNINQSIPSSSLSYNALYDENGNVINGSVTHENTLAWVNRAKYARFSIMSSWNLDEVIISRGASISRYPSTPVSGYVEQYLPIGENDILDFSIGSSKIKNGAILPQHIATDTKEAIKDDVYEYLHTINKTVYENEGQIEYYKNSTKHYSKHLAIRTDAFEVNTTFNTIYFYARYSCNYAIYKTTAITGVPNEIGTLLKEGFLADDGNYDRKINFDEDVTIEAGQYIIIYMWYKSNIYVNGNRTDQIDLYNDATFKALTCTNNPEVGYLNTSWSNSGGKAWQYIACSPIIKYEKEGDIDKLEEDIVNLQEEVDSINNNVEVCVPSTIYAVVGDTLQLYYRSIFRCPEYTNYGIRCICNIGKAYPRYYELIPATGDIGSHTITFEIRDSNGRILGTAERTIIVVASGSSPTSNINVLCVGASATNGGEWPSELKRRLTGSGGTPTADGKTNITFVGRKSVAYNGETVNLEATGGFNFNSYISASTLLHRFNVDTGSPLPNLSVGDVYSYNGNNYTVYEKNLDNGYFSCTGSTNPGSAGGTLTKVSGAADSDATIAFTSASSSGNPFAYNGEVDVEQYAEDYCNGHIDVIICQCFGNGLLSQAYESDADIDSGLENSMMPFINQFRAVFPNCKFIIGGLYLPDMLGGLGKNYGALATYQYYAQVYTRMRVVNKLQRYIDDNNLSNNVFICNWTNEFDNENDFRQTIKSVNTRVSKTEVFGVNGLHPAEAGYFQMADTAYRLFIAKFCQ